MNITTLLNAEEVQALTVKAAMLDPDIIDKMRERYPELSLVEQYAMRRLSKEAASAVISQKKPGWVARMTQTLPTINSKDESVKTHAESDVVTLYQEINSHKTSLSVLESAEKQARKFSTNRKHLLECSERIAELFKLQAVGTTEEDED